MSDNVRHSAMASTRGILHQLWVAVEKCYEMDQAGQKVLIETQGDVTTDSQIEVKRYSDKLTDNHLVFWKTLKNWLHESFDPAQYRSLILLTTQEFGSTAKIANWNNETSGNRLNILQEILETSEARYKKASQKNETTSIPESLKLQRLILADENRKKLKTVLNLFFIEAQSPDTPELYSKIKGQYLKGILEGKQDDFLNALYGFICQPESKDLSRWNISYDDFTTKVQELTSSYAHGTREFPRVNVSLTDDEVSEGEQYLFAQKIADIEYHDAIRNAIEHYQIAITTVNQEFKSYSVPAERTQKYSKDIVDQFQVKYRSACRNSTSPILDAQNLYDEVTGSTPQPLSGFYATPADFRNGLLHSEMDDDNKGLKWKVGKDE